jgi:hypothetical protein
MPPVTDPNSDDLLEAIARIGSREHVLRHLEAAGAMGELDAIQVAHEIDTEPMTAENIAATFVESWDTFVEDTYTDENYQAKLEKLEDEYGDEADAYCDPAPESTDGIQS